MAKSRDVSREKIAVISVGGRQHVVRPGVVIAIDGIPAKEKGARFTDLISGKKVLAKVVGTRSSKVAVRKFKSKVRYLRRRGHRRIETLLEIEKINP